MCVGPPTSEEGRRREHRRGERDRRHASPYLPTRRCSTMSITENTDNAIPIEAWDTILFERFCRFRWIVTSGLSAHSDELLGRRAYPAEAKVHDVGCGFGDTTQRIAR